MAACRQIVEGQACRDTSQAADAKELRRQIRAIEGQVEEVLLTTAYTETDRRHNREIASQLRGKADRLRRQLEASAVADNGQAVAVPSEDEVRSLLDGLLTTFANIRDADTGDDEGRLAMLAFRSLLRQITGGRINCYTHVSQSGRHWLYGTFSIDPITFLAGQLGFSLPEADRAEGEGHLVRVDFGPMDEQLAVNSPKRREVFELWRKQMSVREISHVTASSMPAVAEAIAAELKKSGEAVPPSIGATARRVRRRKQNLYITHADEIYRMHLDELTVTQIRDRTNLASGTVARSIAWSYVQRGKEPPLWTSSRLSKAARKKSV